jgi:glycosyltransferase involved in cell wall biosynthesis
MVSIILTTYNYGHFIQETLESVKNQVYTDWECIIIDSGSIDNTEEIIKSFVNEDQRFKYFQKENKGVSGARNAGIKISSGEFIQFLDGDDILQKNKIASQVNAFEKIPEADIIYSNVAFFDDENKSNLRSSLKGDKPHDWLPKLSGKKDHILNYLKRYNFMIIHSPLLRRSVIERSGMFDENIHALEDWDFWLRCAFSEVYFQHYTSHDDLSLVRVHKSSLSNKKDRMRQGNLLLLQKFIKQKNNFRYVLFFMMKYTELFWDTIFSNYKFPKLNAFITLISIIFFPLWVLIKLSRLLKLI